METISGSQKLFENDENGLMSGLKLFSFSWYSNYCPEIYGHSGKGIDKKYKVNYNIYDWKTNNYNIFIA